MKPSAEALAEARRVAMRIAPIDRIVGAAYDVDMPGDGSGGHHPALATAGDLEVAQRQAMYEAIEVARTGGPWDSGDDQVTEIVEAYLTTMRRAWQPGPIVIGEGDHIVVEIGGKRVKIAHECDGSEPRLSLDDGAEIHYPQGIA